MESLFRFFSERHMLAYLFSGGLVILGLVTSMHINRDQYPTVDFGRLFITTFYPGASAEEVELNVSNKIEEELKSVDHIKETTSISMENSSFMEVTIDPNTPDLNQVEDDIREAVARVTDLPPEVKEAPLVTELKTSIFPIIEVGVAGDLPYPELREYARLFEKKLKDVKGVARVRRYGYRAREIKIEVSPEAMDRYQLPLREIVMAIRARTMSARGGSIESYSNEKNLAMLNEFRNPLEVGNVIVRSTFEGTSVKVKDLAIIKDDFEDERIISRIEGKPAISFVVLKSETADVIRTVDAVKKLVESENKNRPKGVEILYSNDVSKYVRNKFDIVVSNGLSGLVLVVLSLALFLNYRIAFWVAFSIPVVMFGVIFLLPLFGTYLDGITLSAMILVLGIIVDDGIIISENIYDRWQRGESPQDAAVNGVKEVFYPVLTTALTTLLAFIPMFFMPGLMGKFIYVIPLTVCLALFVSQIEVVVALPAHLLAGMKKMHDKSGGASGRHWFDPMQKVFKRLLTFLLRGRYLFILTTVAILVASLWYAKNYMHFILFPTKAAEQFFITLEMPTGTSLQATSDEAKKVEKLISNLPEGEIDSYVTRIGRYGDMVDIQSENYAYFYVNLTPSSKRARPADEIVEDLRGKINELNIFRSVSFYIESGGPRVGQPIVVRVVGSDDAMRKTLADSVYAFLHTVAGVKEIDRDDKIGKKQVDIKADYSKLARLGLTAADIAQTVRIAYDGQNVTNIRYGEEDVNFRVVLQERARKNLWYLRTLTVPNRQGRLIKLGDVARLRIVPGPSEFRHYKGERSTTITADIFEGKTTALMATQQVLDHFKMEKYPGIRLVIGGKAREQQESLAGLLVTFGVAIIGIYFLLVLLFDSITMPLMVLVAIPFGLIGVIWAFALHGESFSFLGILGTIGLVGVVVNDSLVLVSHLNDLRKCEPDKGIIKIVSEGATDRLRSVILTTVTTVAGLLPLAYGLGGQDAYMSPMALALGFGLLFSTPLTLILVPCFYVVGDDMDRIRNKIMAKFMPGRYRRIKPRRESFLSTFKSQFEVPSLQKNQDQYVSKEDERHADEDSIMVDLASGEFSEPENKSVTPRVFDTIQQEVALSSLEESSPIEAKNPYLNRVMIKNINDFYGRKSEVRKIYSRIGAARPQSISIVGERRIGKSSLLYHIYHHENRRKYLQDDSNYLFIFIDFQEKRHIDIPQFLEFVMKAILSECNRDLGLDSNGQPDYQNFKKLVSDLDQNGLKVIMIFDEFEVVTKNPNFDVEFFSFFRSIANNFNIAYIVSSGKNLQDLCHSNEISYSPFFNIFSNITLSQLNEEEAIELISKPSKACGGDLKPYASFVIDIAGYYPFFIQMACASLFEYVSAGERIDETVLDKVREDFLDEAKVHFQQIWDICDEDERGVFLSLSNGKKLHPSQEYILRGLDKAGYIRTKDGRSLIFSSLFEEFVLQEHGAPK